MSETNSLLILNVFLECPRGVHAMRELSILKDQIEQGRQELSRLVDQYGIPNVKVLEQSMVLDELINEYNRYSFGMSISNNSGEVNEKRSHAPDGKDVSYQKLGHGN